MSPGVRVFRRPPVHLAALASCASLLVGFPASAQEAPRAGVEELLERIEELEGKVRELEDQGEPGGQEDVADDERPVDDAQTPPDEGTPFSFNLPLSMELTFRGRLRFRGEFRDPARYTTGISPTARPADPTDAEDFVLLRTRLAFDLKVSKVLRALVELQDSRQFGDVANLAGDRAELHLHQGFMQVRQPFDAPLELTIGRYEVPCLGDQRMVSSLIWGNVGRAWDGAMITYEPEGFWISAMLTNIREGRVFSPDGDDNDDFLFGGIYASARLIKGHEFDAFVYWRNLSDRIFSSEVRPRLGDRKDFTWGARVKGAAGPLGYTVEGAYQHGDVAGDRVDAWAIAVKPWLGFELSEGSNLTIGGEYSFATGDPDPTDGKQQTFDPLLPFGHFYNGHQDLFSWQNSHHGMLFLKYQPFPKLTLHADFHLFWLDKQKDAWINAGKRPIRRDTSGDAHAFVGSELDLYVKHVLWEHIWIWAGYSHFFPGNYVRDTGRSTDQDWAFFMAELRF